MGVEVGITMPWKELYELRISRAELDQLVTDVQTMIQVYEEDGDASEICAATLRDILTKLITTRETRDKYRPLTR